MCIEGSGTSADELRAWLRLSHTDGLGPVRARALLESLGPPEAILEAGPGAVADVLRSRPLAQALFQDDPARELTLTNALAWLRGGLASAWDRPPRRRSILMLAGADYPPRLLDLADPPLVLYCIGDPAWLSRPQIGIVGSRNATALGARTAREFAAALAARGWTVTSGMAEGIDQAAHEGALEGRPGGAFEGAFEDSLRDAIEDAAQGATVAALGTGIDRIYPSRHRVLAGRIAERGALLSEQPLGMPPLPANFPRRNRLIAALASGVLVVEANLRSGSLITARLAAEIGREVMAVPGSIHSPLARGSNSLIRQGARLVESAGDILGEVPEICQVRLRSAVGSGSNSKEAEVEAALLHPEAGNRRLPEEQASMLAAMSADPVRLETLAARQRLPVSRVLAALQTLELNRLVERQLDGSYVRLP